MITKWLTKTEVMKLVGISRYLLDKAIQSGQLKYQIINKSMLFTERDVEEWQTNTHTDFISEEPCKIRALRWCSGTGSNRRHEDFQSLKLKSILYIKSNT